MFVPYALAMSLALALIGLFCEIANHFRWSVRRKWWGGLAVAAASMGVVPFLASAFSQIAVAAACSSVVLALGVLGQREVKVSHQGEALPDAELSTEVHNAEELAREMLEGWEDSETTVEISEVVDAMEAVEVIEAVEAIEEVAAIEEIETIEAVEVIEEVEAIEEVEVIDDLSPSTIPEQLAVEAVAEKRPEADPEWLNGRIAAGYEAKAAGETERAMEAFEQAAGMCGDAELLEMLRDEIAECRIALRLYPNIDILHAS